MLVNINLPVVNSVDTTNVIHPIDNHNYRTQEARERYYNYYYSYGAHFKPRTIFEIGVRAGYTGYFLLLGSRAEKFRGIDLETYMLGSTGIALPLLKKVCSDVQITVGDSHKLTVLDHLYDMIHIDGDHSYEGKIMDLELAINNLSPSGVVIVDDYNGAAGEAVKRATDDFVNKYKLEMAIFPTLTGHAIIRRPK
jgi:predicted O-methyltransferase YrrM